MTSCSLVLFCFNEVLCLQCGEVRGEGRSRYGLREIKPKWYISTAHAQKAMLSSTVCSFRHWRACHGSEAVEAGGEVGLSVSWYWYDAAGQLSSTSAIR